MDASFWRETFEAALRITRAWRAEQAHSETLLAAAIEFDGRLTLLGPSAHRTRPEALGALLRTGDVAAIDALRARHERGLSNLRTALNTSVERFGALQLEAAALHGRSWERYTRLQHSLPQEEALALASEPASVVIGAGRGVLAEQGLLPEAPTLLGWLRDASASLDARIPTPGSVCAAAKARAARSACMPPSPRPCRSIAPSHARWSSSFGCCRCSRHRRAATQPRASSRAPRASGACSQPWIGGR